MTKNEDMNADDDDFEKDDGGYDARDGPNKVKGEESCTHSRRRAEVPAAVDRRTVK